MADITFVNDVKSLASKLTQYKNYIDNEENTKTALVLPMMKLLNYDIHDPSIVRSEYPCSFGPGTSNRVDYATVEGKKPLVLIEVKPLGTNLDKYYGQIKKYYFAVHPAFCLLTDGNEYRLYANADNKMYFDAHPLVTLKLEDEATITEDIYHAISYGFNHKQTEKELELYGAAKKVLNDNGIKDICYHKTRDYLAITPKGSKLSICRFKFDKKTTWLYFYMYIPNKEERYPIASIADVAKYSSCLLYTSPSPRD